MEDILKEILYELKGIRKEIRVIESNPNPKEIKISIGEDLILEKVVNSLNEKNRLTGETVIKA